MVFFTTLLINVKVFEHIYLHPVAYAFYFNIHGPEMKPFFFFFFNYYSFQLNFVRFPKIENFRNQEAKYINKKREGEKKMMSPSSSSIKG